MMVHPWVNVHHNSASGAVLLHRIECNGLLYKGIHRVAWNLHPDGHPNYGTARERGPDLPRQWMFTKRQVEKQQ